MEIELGPLPKYEEARFNAHWSRIGVDSSLRVDEYTIETYKSHLKDIEKCPTVGLLARKKYLTGKPMNYPMYARRNMSYINKQLEINLLNMSIKKQMKTMYPRTQYIRQYIIDNGRVLLDSIEATRKYSIFDKLKIVLKRFI